MEQKCPNPDCGWPVTPEDEYCPRCDIPLKSESSPAEVPPPNDPSFHETFDSGLMDKTSDSSRRDIDTDEMSEKLRGVEEDQLLICPGCGISVLGDYKVCHKCGTKLTELSESLAFQPEFELQFEKVGIDLKDSREISVKGVGPVQQYDPEKSPAADSAWDLNASVPILGYFNSGKIYNETMPGYLELMIINNCHSILDQLEMDVSGEIMSNAVNYDLPFTIGPGNSGKIRIPGFVPDKPGEDLLQLKVKGKAREPGGFYLKGSFPVKVRAKDAPAPSMSIKIDRIDAPTYIDEDLFSKFDTSLPDSAETEIENWINVDLFWDRAKHERLEKSFPDACIEKDICAISDEDLLAIRRLSPENAPRCALTLEDKTSYFIVPGRTLLIGRNPKTSHVPAVLYPEVRFERENLRTSRNHCRLIIKKNMVYLRDTSTCGTRINGERIPRNRDELVADDDTILIADHLELKLNIFTDGSRILALLLRRIGNKTNHKYILANGPVPMGSHPDLPVRIPAASDMLGTICYNIKFGSWRFQNWSGIREPSKETVLNPFQQIEFGIGKIWFSML
jgi:hypothetical protein